MANSHLTTFSGGVLLVTSAAGAEDLELKQSPPILTPSEDKQKSADTTSNPRSSVDESQAAPSPDLRIQGQDSSTPRVDPIIAKPVSISATPSEGVNLSSPFEPKALTNFADYHPIEFANPVEMLGVVDPRFQELPDPTNGVLQPPMVELYDWQLETNIFLAQGYKWTDKDPLTMNICACNGSGKDAYLIAPLAVWLTISKIRSRVIITSASFDQLTSQTEAHIRYVVDCVNRWALKTLGAEILQYKQFHIICSVTGSEIKMFAKDDPGRVEGYHPFPDYPGAEMCVIINEAKTVDDGIQGAMKRFTGFNRWINISSSGRTSGPFYKSYLNSKPWSGIKGYDPAKSYSRKVTAYECPHISPKTIEAARIELGETSALFRSIYLSEFTSLEEAVMISGEVLEKLSKLTIPHVMTQDNGCGLDTALGGDETSLRMRRGNKIVDRFDFRCADAVDTAWRIKYKLDEWKSIYQLVPEEIFADDGGLSRAITDILKQPEFGWEGINRVLNQSAALYGKNNFGNRGAENWFRAKRFCELGLLILQKDDELLITQLGSRFYREKESTTKLYLESKAEAKARGHGSPDRGDALVLSLCNLDLETCRQEVDKLGGSKTTTSVSSQKLNRLGGILRANGGRGMTIEQLDEFRFNRAFGKQNADGVTLNASRYGSIHSSLSVALQLQSNRKQSPLSSTPFAGARNHQR